MQANRPLIEFARIDHSMNGVIRIHGTGMSRIHLDNFRTREIADAFINVL